MEIKIKRVTDKEVKKPTKTRTRVKKPIEKKETTVLETLDDIDIAIDEKTLEPETIEKGDNIEEINIQDLEWRFEIKEKSAAFYFLLFGLAALFIFMGYKYNNWILTLIVIIGFVMIIQRNSKIENFKIDNLGITIQNQKIKWANIDRCGIEPLDKGVLLISIIPNTFPNLKIYVPFLEENERKVLYLINKYSKFSDVKSNMFDQITKKIMF